MVGCAGSRLRLLSRGFVQRNVIANHPRLAGAHHGGVTTTLITGANRSLGLETTRRLIAAGHVVYAGMRDLASSDAARELGAHVVQLDVTDSASVKAAIASCRSWTPSSTTLASSEAPTVSMTFTPTRWLPCSTRTWSGLCA